MSDTIEIERRLEAFAEGLNDNAPSPILDTYGSPSQEVKAFCNKHNITLDWALLGEAPQYRGRAMPTMTDAVEDATFLHGMLEGLDILIGDSGWKGRGSNAVYALSQEIVAKCDRLVRDLGRLADANENEQQGAN